MMTDETRVPLQTAVENAMHDLGLSENRWETTALFSADGLLMASCGESPVYSRENLLEFCFSLFETVGLLHTANPFDEIIIYGTAGRRMVFRYFEAWGEHMILCAVIAGKKGYRRALTRLISSIRALG